MREIEHKVLQRRDKTKNDIQTKKDEDMDTEILRQNLSKRGKENFRGRNFVKFEWE